MRVPYKNNNNAKNYKSLPSYDDILNNNDLITLTQTSITTTTSTQVRRQSLMLSKDEARRLFPTSSVQSKLDDLYGFTGFPETANNHEQQLQPSRITSRRSTLGCSHSTSHQQSHTMEIQFSNVPESVRKIKVMVHFTDMGPLWLTRIYQSYEHDLWQKSPREYNNEMPRNNKTLSKKRCPWYYDCLLCYKKYCSYPSLKGHLNHHLEFYPYGCKLCVLQYTTRRGVTKHLKSKHNVEREEWNEYIGN